MTSISDFFHDARFFPDRSIIDLNLTQKNLFLDRCFDVWFKLLFQWSQEVSKRLEKNLSLKHVAPPYRYMRIKTRKNIEKYWSKIYNFFHHRCFKSNSRLKSIFRNSIEIDQNLFWNSEKLASLDFLNLSTVVGSIN